jgi:hypothetical protein
LELERRPRRFDRTKWANYNHNLNENKKSEVPGEWAKENVYSRLFTEG